MPENNRVGRMGRSDFLNFSFIENRICSFSDLDPIPIHYAFSQTESRNFVAILFDFGKFEPRNSLSSFIK